MSLYLFALAIGFVAAGLLSATHAAFQDEGEVYDEPTGDAHAGRVSQSKEQARQIYLYFDTPLAIAWSMFVCIFAGPYLLAAKGLYLWRSDFLPFSALAFCFFIAATWSFCSGVVLMETAHYFELI